jgi:hypothetical protein
MWTIYKYFDLYKVSLELEIFAELLPNMLVETNRAKSLDHLLGFLKICANDQFLSNFPRLIDQLRIVFDELTLLCWLCFCGTNDKY